MLSLESPTRVAAYCVVVDSARRVLLCRLSIEELDRGTWTLPGGGIEFGEDPAVAAIRELAEETGLRGRIERLLAIDSRLYPPNARRAAPLHAIRIIYAVSVQGGELRNETGGSTDRAAWFARNEICGLPTVDLVSVALSLLAEASVAAHA